MGLNYHFSKQPSEDDMSVKVTRLDEKAAAQAWRQRDKRDHQPISEPETGMVGRCIKALGTESAIGKDERKAQMQVLFNQGMTSYIDLAFEMNLAESTIRRYGKELGLTFIDQEF